MNPMLSKVLICLVIVSTITSCRKREALDWDSYWMAPVAHGRLDFNKLIEDDVITTSSDSTLILDFEQDVFSITLDEFISIPDTTVTNTFSSPTGGTFAENIEFIDEPKNFVYNGIGVNLAEADLKAGVINYEVKSPLEKKTIVRYTIPSVSINGQELELIITVPGAPPGGNSVVTGSVDLSGYHLDLRGVSGVDFNTLITELGVKVAPGEGSATLTTMDIFEVKSTFQGVVPSYAKGYFGEQSITESNQGVANELLAKYVGGTIDIDELEVDFFLENGVGVDGRIKINNITAMNPVNGLFLNLQHPIIGQTININRAQDVNPLIPGSYQAQFNQLNSNIEDFFEVLPTHFGYDVNLDINPLGNVSNGNDFAYGSSSVKAIMGIQMPLCLIANNLTLQDTFDIAFQDGNNPAVKSMELEVQMTNNFPFDLSPELYLLDEMSVVTDTLLAQNIPSALLNASNAVISPSNWQETISLNESQAEILKNNGRLVVRVSLTTAVPGTHIKIKSNHFIDVDIVAKAKINSKL